MSLAVFELEVDVHFGVRLCAKASVDDALPRKATVGEPVVDELLLGGHTGGLREQLDLFRGVVGQRRITPQRVEVKLEERLFLEAAVGGKGETLARAAPPV